MDVRDVAKGCLEAAGHGIKGNCYILSNRYFTVRELLECVRRSVGGRKKFCLPIGIARAFVPFFEWIGKITHTRPLYTRYSLYTISSNSHFTHDKATAELGYHPRDMQDTIRDTISWLRGNPGSAGKRIRSSRETAGGFRVQKSGSIRFWFPKQADSGKGEGKPLFVKRKVLLAASDFENGVRTPFYPIRPALLSIPKAGKL